MANRYPLVIDTSNGGNFAELPEGDNLLLTNSSITNVLNISAVGNIATGSLEVNGVTVTGDYNDLQNLPDIPDTLTDLGIADGTAGHILQANGDGTFQFVSRQAANVGNFQFTDNVMTVASGETEIRSPANLVLYPTDNIWISAGTKLIFEGTAPDDFEAKLQATTVTADRDVIIPDEDGTLATREWVNSQNFGTVIVDWTNIQNTPTTLGGYGITDAATAAQGALATSAVQPGSLSTLAFTGQWTDVINRPTVLSAFTNDQDFVDGSFLSGQLANYVTSSFLSSTLSNYALSSTVPTTLTDLGIADGSNGQVLSTDGSGNFIFTTISAGGGTQNIFSTVSSDNGSVTANSTNTILTVTGGIDLSTTITGQTLTINFDNDTGYIASDSAIAAQPVRQYYVDQLAFPNATTWHGAIAHSHADAAMYFAHGGAWNKLANDADVPTVLTDLGIVDGLIAGQVLTTDGAGNFTFQTPSGGGGATTLDTLTDVDLGAGANNGDIISYNSSTGNWEPNAPASGGTVADINDITNVKITSPTDGQVLTYQAATSDWQNVTPSGGGGGTSLGSRTTFQVTTSSLTDQSQALATLSLTFPGYILYKIETDAAAWVRIYTDANSRSTDSGRSIDVDPINVSGLISEVVTVGAQTVKLTPGVIGFNDESPVTNDVPIIVRNLSGTTRTITVTVTVVQIEA